MKPFVYTRAGSMAEAVDAASRSDVAILAGGTELLNWMRIGVREPREVVDIGRLPGGGEIRLEGDVVHIGALATLSDVATHELVRDRFPVLSQAIQKSASAQLRNLATIGGSPLQATRCPYFRSESTTPCNRRQPGSGCAARDGIADNHAIFGWTDECVAVQPSDPATALVALDSHLVTAGRNGGRRLPIRDLHLLPGEDPTTHHVLRAGEVIVDVEISGTARASAYVKVRERESYEFALVSAAVVLDLDGDLITRARIAIGSVAMKPWRLEPAERLLTGTRLASPDVADSVKAAFAEARPLPGSEYKIPLAQNAVLRAIEEAASP
jgi:xanthine dehydrogenase YagS FAD-binding subunit